MSAISNESSIRLRLLNFPLIIGVVYIHAYSTTIDFAGVSLGPTHLNYLTDFVRTLISQGLARIAVPLFFLMSGYFFFLGCSWSWRGYAEKLAARAKTLLLPYMFWTILVVAVHFLGLSIQPVKEYFDGDLALLSQFSAFGLTNTIFGFTRAPAAYHFWFIRDLMLLMLCSPLIILLVRYVAWPFLGGVFWLWISAGWPIYTPDAVGVLFFSFGIYMAMKDKNLFLFDGYGAWFVIAYLPILVADVIWIDSPYNNYLHRCGIVIGLVAVLFVSKFGMTDGRLKNILLRLGGSSFFVYAAHEPLLGIVRTLAFQFLPLDLTCTMLLIYLFVPLSVIALLVVLHAVLAALMPRALRVVTGGRSME